MSLRLFLIGNRHPRNRSGDLMDLVDILGVGGGWVIAFVQQFRRTFQGKQRTKGRQMSDGARPVALRYTECL